MATTYSGWSDTWRPSGSSVDKKYRARLDTSTGSNATQFWVTATVYININSKVDGYYKGRVAGSSQTTYTSGQVNTTFSSGNLTVTAISKTYYWTRTTSAYAVSVSGSAWSDKQDWDGYWVTTTQSFTVPALASYAITYDGNLPSGASGSVTNVPANDVKYYGINKAISSVSPMLTNWTFQGWNTNSGGTGTDYASGATYSTNAGLNLYAKWSMVVNLPTIYNIQYQRMDDVSTPNDEGNIIKITFDYIGCTVPADTTPSKTTSIAVKLNNTTLALYSGTASFSGTGSKTLYYMANVSPNFPTTNSYPIVFTLTTNGQTTVTINDTFPSSTYPIDISADASSMAFGVPTINRSGIFWKLDETNGGTDEDLYDAIVALGWDNDVLQ